MHQEPQPPHQLTALAVVIESSLTIAQEWPAPLFQYCMHLFKRINEAHHPAKVPPLIPHCALIISFLTLAQGSFRRLWNSRYCPVSHTLQEIFYRKYNGIQRNILRTNALWHWHDELRRRARYGSTRRPCSCFGGNFNQKLPFRSFPVRQMFDDLQKLPNTKICGSFILHIAASAPDNSLRPEWNDSELMDDMTWESLPVEFKKVWRRFFWCVVLKDS
jgi:hypothetical protein